MAKYFWLEYFKHKIYTSTGVCGAVSMKIACVGAGPAGLYFAISMKLRDPAHEIEVFERNRAGDTFGWGVVFSDQTVENLKANDPVSAQSIDRRVRPLGRYRRPCRRRDDHAPSGHGFIGIGRKRLLEILQDRARELGVELHFETEVEPPIAKC